MLGISIKILSNIVRLFFFFPPLLLKVLVFFFSLSLCVYTRLRLKKSHGRLVFLFFLYLSCYPFFLLYIPFFFFQLCRLAAVQQQKPKHTTRGKKKKKKKKRSIRNPFRERRENKALRTRGFMASVSGRTRSGREC